MNGEARACVPRGASIGDPVADGARLWNFMPPLLHSLGER
jgi:hypothetical protein